MNKIILVSGSPHVGGVTDYLTGLVSEGLKTISNSSLMEVVLRNNQFNYCRGCNKCDNSGFCIIRDNMDSLIDEFLNFDVFVAIYPLYFMAPPAIMKSFIDRFQSLYYCYNKDPLSVSGLRKLIILGCGGSKGLKDPNGASRRIFKSVCLSIGATLTGSFFLENAETRKTVEGRSDALQIAGEIIQLVKAEIKS